MLYYSNVLLLRELRVADLVARLEELDLHDLASKITVSSRCPGSRHFRTLQRVFNNDSLTLLDECKALSETVRSVAKSHFKVYMSKDAQAYYAKEFVQKFDCKAYVVHTYSALLKEAPAPNMPL